MAPTFSVIIPCYKQGAYLDRTLQSVHNQTLASWECLIIDDGSPDESATIAKSWEYKDKRFKLFRKENGGVSSARNLALDNAVGKYVLFLDSDDLILETKLAEALKAHEDGAAVVVSSFDHLSNGEIFPPFCQLKQEHLTFDSMLLQWDREFSIPIHCGTFQREAIEGLKFNTEIAAGEDWLFWLNTFMRKPKAVYIDKTLTRYRIHPESITQDLPEMYTQKINAHNIIYNILDESYKALFFERFSLETLQLRESLKRIHQMREIMRNKKLKNRIRAFFRKLKNKQ